MIENEATLTRVLPRLAIILAAMIAACSAFETTSGEQPPDASTNDAAAEGSVTQNDAATSTDADASSLTKIVFVTFDPLMPGKNDAGTSPFMLEGDALCNREGSAALGPGHTFVMWASNHVQSAITRVKSDGPWFVGKNGPLAFPNRAAIYVSGPLVPINRYAGGTLAPDLPVWTGTDQQGNRASDCVGWSEIGGGNYGVAGKPYIAGPKQWTDSALLACAAAKPVICFEL